MPRKLPPPKAVASVDTLLPPPPPSPIILALRKDWRWAAISQFVWTFSDAFGLVDWDIETLEKDFDGDEQALIPTLVAKLLFALTYNRQINRDNAFEHLRKQYLKRTPDDHPLGTEEEPVEWATLGLGQKVGILHQLCEWQMDDPARFRGLLKSEDDAVSWRIDPVGWDKTGNTYWLFDDNRLWIQRVPPAPPRPPKKSSLKAKRALKRSRATTTNTPAAPKKSHKKRVRTPAPTLSRSPSPLPTPKNDITADVVLTGSRRRAQVAFYGNPTPTALALKRGAGTPLAPGSSGSFGIGGSIGQTGSGGRATRSSARAGPGLGETPSKSTPSKPPRSGAPASTTPLPLGTRVSRRLRNVDDEWQQIPAEWLGEEGAKPQEKGKGKGKGKEKEEDEESELSELTDEEEHEAKLRAVSSTPAKGKAADLPAEAETNGTNGHTDSPLTDLDAEAAAAASETKAPASPDGSEFKPEDDADAMDVDEPEKPKEDDAEAEEGEDDGEEEEDLLKAAIKEANNLPEGFVEWEAICVTLYDWRTFPEQFANSRDPDEKALYQMLKEEVGPTIIEVLVAREQERIKQELFNNRKRSSRIATRELEKEEAARRELAQREMEERMEKNRAEEQRQAAEAEEAAAREKAREDRLREREERAAAREEALAKKAEEEAKAKEKMERKREKRKRRREGEVVSSDSEEESGVGSVKPGSGAASGTITPSQSTASKATTGDRWELNCEVCLKTGWNVDGDKDMVSCDECGRWQHVECHDRLDRSQGRHKRNWEKVDFKCKECQNRAAKKRARLDGAVPNANGHASSPLVSRPLADHAAHPSSPLGQTPPYPVVPGSAHGPPVPLDPSRPPPPPLQPGQYYLPYPHPESGRQGQPAGYAVYYRPGEGQPGQPGQQVSPPAPGHVAHAEGYARSPTVAASPGFGPGYPAQPPAGYRRTSQGSTATASPHTPHTPHAPHASHYPPHQPSPHQHHSPHYPPIQPAPPSGSAPVGSSRQLPPLHQLSPPRLPPIQSHPGQAQAHGHPHQLPPIRQSPPNPAHHGAAQSGRRSSPPHVPRQPQQPTHHYGPPAHQLPPSQHSHQPSHSHSHQHQPAPRGYPPQPQTAQAYPPQEAGYTHYGPPPVRGPGPAPGQSVNGHGHGARYPPHGQAHPHAPVPQHQHPGYEHGYPAEQGRRLSRPEQGVPLNPRLHQ
ncbi:hypothetical protein IAT38_007876 [Cryptococcus sp. DSM 104549]